MDLDEEEDGQDDATGMFCDVFQLAVYSVATDQSPWHVVRWIHSQCYAKFILVM